MSVDLQSFFLPTMLSSPLTKAKFITGVITLITYDDWSCRWDLPLNVSKDQHLSIEGSPDFQLALPEKDDGLNNPELRENGEVGHCRDPAFTPSANVLSEKCRTS